MKFANIPWAGGYCQVPVSGSNTGCPELLLVDGGPALVCVRDPLDALGNPTFEGPCKLVGGPIFPLDNPPILDVGGPEFIAWAPILVGGAPMLFGGAPMFVGGAPILLGGGPIFVGGAPILVGGAPILVGGGALYCDPPWGLTGICG